MSDLQDPGLSFLSRIWRAAGMAWGDKNLHEVLL